MDVKVFRTFLVVARERHFGRAAEQLYITQAAVSSRIKQLEEFFDTTLFVRQRNNIQLTAAGSALIPHAQVMVRTLQQAVDELARVESRHPQLIIAAPENLWDGFLNTHLQQLLSVDNGYLLSFETLSAEPLRRALINRAVDLGFSFAPLLFEELDCYRIGAIELFLYSSCSDEHSARVRYQIDWGAPQSAAEGDLCREHAGATSLCSSARLALSLLKNHQAEAYLPLSMVDALAESDLHRVKGVTPLKREIYMSFHKEVRSLSGITAIRQHLLSCC